MRVPSAPRRTGARNKPVHFQYVNTERGQPWEAFIAGPTWWGYLHMTKPSKPCVYEITNRALECRFCASGKARVPVAKGWVPLYRLVDGEPVMVPVDEAQRDKIDNWRVFTKVTVGRARGKNSGVFIQMCTSQEPKWGSTLPERTVEADVTESLLRVWGVAEVTSFFSGASDNAVSQEREGNFEVTRECIDPTTKPAPGASGKYVPPDDARLNGPDDSLKRTLGRAKLFEPSPNGKHDGG